jgi:hypothetical protein
VAQIVELKALSSTPYYCHKQQKPKGRKTSTEGQQTQSRARNTRMSQMPVGGEVAEDLSRQDLEMGGV